VKRLLFGLALATFVWTGAASAQSVRMVGTVASWKIETAEIEIKPDKGESLLARMTGDSLVQKVAPGEKDLKHAEAIRASDIAAGDRVLVVLVDGSKDIRRIVVMSAKDITGRDEADRQDWIKRGVSGVVAAKIGDEITLRARSMTGTGQTTVVITPATTFRRYAPDSVKFADARVSSVSDVTLGDQLRARGTKSPDGSKVTADEVVFGTFVTKAGSITAVNAENQEITIQDMTSHQPLTIKVTADSNLKTMPDMGPMIAGGGPSQGGPPQGGSPGGPPAGGAPDFSQLLEHMPAVKLAELKAGDTIVVSSTKGARSDQITAITLLANAGALIKMASAQGGNGRGAQANGPSMGGLPAGMGGVELPGMIP
jgi:hypothetical protein